jgi:integrase
MARQRRQKGTGRVYEYPKKSGIWWAQLPERDTRAGPKWRVKDKATGEKELTAKLREMEQGVRVYDRTDTLGDWMTYWNDVLVASGDKPTTHESYDQVIRLYILSQPISKVRLADLDIPDLRQWVAGLTRIKSERTKKRLSPRTIRNAYARLRTALMVAFEDKRISWLPPKTLKLPPVDDIERRALTIAECNALLEALAAHRLFMLYKLEIATGMREAEIIGLQWEMIDWQRGEIHLTSQLKWLRADKRWERLSLKNRKKRVLPLDIELLEELQAHQMKLAEERKERGEKWQEHDLVFPSEAGTPLNARNLLRHLETTATKAKLGKVTFHELRHTAGSLMLQNGKTMTTVSKILGHSSVGVTEKIYAHSYEDDKREAVASVTRRLRPATKEAKDASKN